MFIRKELTIKFAAEKSVSIEINIKKFVYTILLLITVAGDRSGVDVARTRRRVCGVKSQSFLRSLGTGVQHGRNRIVVFSRLILQIIQVCLLQAPRASEKKSPRLASSIVPDLEA